MSYENLIERVEHAIEGTPFSFELREYENGIVDVLFEGYSPAGEDCIIEETIDTNNPATGGKVTFCDIWALAARKYLNYNAEDHAEMWIPIRGSRGVPESIRTLIEDAEAIGLMLKDLVERLEKG